jgi:hypothetical protein
MPVGQFLKIDQQQKTPALALEDKRSILRSWCHHQFASVSITPLSVTPASGGLGLACTNRLGLDAVTGAPGISYLVIRNRYSVIGKKPITEPCSPISSRVSLMGFAGDACSNCVAFWAARGPINLSLSSLFVYELFGGA